MVAVILLGSLLEAAYLFRWFSQALRPGEEAAAVITALLIFIF